jgi:hypothetical protein
MCGKALPDLVKLAKPVLDASGSASAGGGMGVGGRPSGQMAGAPSASPHPASPAPVRPTPPARAENPNRDLSYLLHDDHVPARGSRAPFLLGGLVLAAVAVFFFMRGGGKPAPAAGSGTGDATASQPAPPSGADAPPAETKVEPPKAEAPKAEPAPETPADGPKADPEKAEIPPAAAATVPAGVPAQEVRHPAPPVTTARARPAPRPSRLLNKPSPAKAVEPEVEADAASDSSATPSDDCEKQLPAMRKAAAHGDAKAKADLGLVYYAGQCVPRDLPTAYHWYALALRTAPDSPQISAQLEAIWKQMSPAERQLALKPQ